MKALLPLSVVVTLAAAPAFSECVAPLSDVRIPNGNKATMGELLAANHAVQENTTEFEEYTHCMKAEQNAKIAAIGPDITDEQRSKIASEYVNRQNAETQKLQRLSDLYNASVASYRAKLAAAKATDEANEEAAAVSVAEQDAAEKARRRNSALKEDEQSETPVVHKATVPKADDGSGMPVAHKATAQKADEAPETPVVPKGK
jgi:hypothetical protein